MSNSPHRILIVQTWGFGDALMTVSLFKLVREHFPAAHLVALLAFPEIGAVLLHNRLADSIRILPHKASKWTKANAFLRLRKERFDTAIVATQLSWGYAFFARFLSGIPNVIADSQSRWLPSSTIFHDTDLALPRFIANGMLLKPLVNDLTPGDVGRCDARLASSQISDRAQECVAGLAASQGVYAIHLGSGGQPVKRIPISLADRLTERIAQEFPGSRQLYIQGPSDPPFESLPVSLRDRLVPIVGWSLHDLQHLLAGCDAVITGDTGITHITAAAGGRAVVLVGPGDIVRARPWGKQHAIIGTRTPPPCMPCYKTPLFDNCPYDVKCMTSISVDDVIAALKNDIPVAFARRLDEWS